MGYHARYPSWRRTGKRNTWYVPDAWFTNRICKGTAFTTDGDTIKVSNHYLGIMNQCDQKVVFTCRKSAYRRYVRGILDYVESKKESLSPSEYIILPYCPSCGEAPPKEFVEQLRSKSNGQ